LQNREVRRLESIVKLVEEPAFGRNNRRAARLTVNGVVMPVEEVPGEPHLPLSRDEVTAKFVRYVDPILGGTRARKAVDGILDGSLATGLADLFSAFDQ